MAYASEKKAKLMLQLFYGLELLEKANPGMPARRVYNAIAAHLDYEGRCWMTQQALADWLGCSRRSVIDGINELVACRLLYKFKSGNKCGYSFPATVAQVGQWEEPLQDMGYRRWLKERKAKKKNG